MKNGDYATLQRRHDNRQHPDSITVTSGSKTGWKVEKTEHPKPRSWDLIGPDGEYVGVRAIGPDHCQIVAEHIDTDLDDTMIKFCPLIVWEDIYAEFEADGIEAVVILLNDIEKRGARAFQD